MSGIVALITALSPIITPLLVAVIGKINHSKLSKVQAAQTVISSQISGQNGTAPVKS